MQQVKELFDTVLSRLETLAKTKTVVGDPMEIKGKTLIPLIELSLGIGGGGGEGTGEGEKMKEGKGHGEGIGGGVGGGLTITPVAVLCVDQNDVSAYAVEKKGFASRIADMMPQMLDKVMQLKAKKEESQK
jgi:uncharacterized spore protein YtfJ